MKVPLWIAAAVPAAVAGHTWLYAICACGNDGAAHTWVLPAFRLSLALLTALCAVLLYAALTGSAWLTVGRIERSGGPLLCRLFLAQTLFYAAAERAEGNTPALLGVALQLVVAIAVAVLILGFARVLDRAAAHVRSFAAYLRRHTPADVRFSIEFQRQRPAMPAGYAAGYARFQRPPPAF